MNKLEKIDAAIALLVAHGMKANKAYPPGHRLLRKLGVPLRPPSFSEFWALAVGFGVYFALAWGLLMYWFDVGSIGVRLLAISPFSGLIFGLTMAAFFKYRARQLGLPHWDGIGRSDDE